MQAGQSFVATHPLWRPYDPLATLQRRQYRIAQRQVPVAGVVPFDTGWAQQYLRIRGLIEDSLAQDALFINHVGSTAVPDLVAKPIIDVDLIVRDSSRESDYLPALHQHGFRLIAREPEWEEHRCFTLADPNCNVHVFSRGAVEPQRHTLFRDWLAEHGRDRERYGELKARLAGRDLALVDDYNGQKAALIYDLFEKIFIADPRFRHDPRPRT